MVVDDRLNARLRPGEQVAIARGQRMQKQRTAPPPSPDKLALTPVDASIPALSFCCGKLCDADLIDKSVKCYR
ncbi:hypothetical protein NUBL21977_47400 [Klebsiella quasipneumoniae]|nr:hypothetical protein NUBL21977_47400 [Klebsiella quasipneumoniae]